MLEKDDCDPKEEVYDSNPIPEEAGHIVHRSFELRDHHFITNSWNKSFRKTKPELTDPVYYRGQDKLIYEISKNADLIVASDEKHTFYVYAYGIGKYFSDENSLILHYVYVKHAYRRRGIGTSLIRALGANSRTLVRCSHWTPPCRDFLKPFRHEYDPYIVSLGA